MQDQQVHFQGKLVAHVPGTESGDIPLVVVSGNIGTGKTTLCNYLQEQLPSAKIFYEKFEENEHLKPFYAHLKTHGKGYNPHSYASQLRFLQGRIRQESEFFKSQCNDDATEADREEQRGNSDEPQQFYEFHVADRSIFEDAGVFAKNHYISGLMNLQEYENYQSFFRAHQEKLQVPRLVIHLKLSPALLCARIRQRGREMEKDISEEYLSSLQALYDDYVQDMQQRGCQILEINTETREFYPQVIQKLKELRQSVCPIERELALN